MRIVNECIIARKNRGLETGLIHLANFEENYTFGESQASDHDYNMVN